MKVEGGVRPDQPQCRRNAFHALQRPAHILDFQRLGDRIEYRPPGIHRLIRVLEHHLGPAPELLQGPSLEMSDVLQFS